MGHMSVICPFNDTLGGNLKLRFLLLIPLFFMLACAGPEIKEDGKPTTEGNITRHTVDFQPKYLDKITIFPTYRFLGSERTESSGAFRNYFVWENKFEGKYVLILQLFPRGEDTFPPDVQWVNPDGALYHRGMRAAYDSLSKSAVEIINKLGGELPDCFIVGQEVVVDRKLREAILKVLIVPDKFCSGNWISVMEELDRVIIQGGL